MGLLDNDTNGNGNNPNDKGNPSNKKSGDDKDKDDDIKTAILTYVDENLIEELYLITMSDNDDIWWYDETTGIFRQNAESIIKHRLEVEFHGKMDNKRTSEALGVIRRMTQAPRDIFNPSIWWIATKNCMINIATGQTRAFSPEFVCTTNIPVVYRRDEYSCPFYTGCVSNVRYSSKIMKFLYEIMSEEDVEIFLNYLAYSLVREYRFNFWMILNGEGQNGKSILIQLMERFLGEDNVSGETLDRLLHERFAVAQLYQKLLNVDADVSAEVVFDNTGIIKKLTGNDLHTAELKYRKPWPFRNHAKLVFSCNKMPETTDITDAFFRRLLIINFTHQFFGDKDDPHIIDKLCTEEEFSMLLNELLGRLPLIIKYGIRKVTDEVLEKNFKRFMKSANSLMLFVREALEQNVPQDKLIRSDLYEWYLKYCEDNGITPESDASITQKLQNDYGIKLTRKTRHRGLQGCFWIAVRKKDWKVERNELEKAQLETLVEQRYLDKESLESLR